MIVLGIQGTRQRRTIEIFISRLCWVTTEGFTEDVSTMEDASLSLGRFCDYSGRKGAVVNHALLLCNRADGERRAAGMLSY